MKPGTTICEYLDEATNKCTIYETRPKICRMSAWKNPPDEVLAKNCAEMHRLIYDTEPATDPS